MFDIWPQTGQAMVAMGCKPVVCSSDPQTSFWLNFSHLNIDTQIKQPSGCPSHCVDVEKYSQSEMHPAYFRHLSYDGINYSLKDPRSL